ncbi:LacI family DNA-binding transcriptional regulator [Mycoplasma sp. NEAQ87857]|uniref:LacI family DNA-binding transcriptional regulator n=1 Tax=Mycoplasma sp. NEAQ87857 TaxID=2683967 RepID=UPI001319B573|nr:LacI family DNA-binding transcriptional regulator [Mycoplasma sp. NEAQ87857]QGZ97860.1 LacI family DNA-binding transcriptional regulator [Mycoplasma sp. NEAQ87857]
MKKQISYKDISELANVSISTISRYYNKGYVSKKTREKIEEVVKRYQYFPNHGARLIRGKDNSIFVIMPVWGDSAYTHIVNGIIAASKKSNRRVNTTYTGVSTQEYINTVRYILSWRPTSIVIFIPQYDKELFDFLKTIEDVSIVVYGHQVNGVNWIKPDESTAFYLMTKKFHSLMKDNDKMLFLSDLKLSPVQIQDRWRGFVQACNELGVIYEEYTIPAKKKQKDIIEFDKYTRKFGFSNIVCSSHEAYISLAVIGTRGLRLSDIGYSSIYDSINNYKIKIFIDYAKIGLEIEKMLIIHNAEGKNQGKIIKLDIL